MNRIKEWIKNISGKISSRNEKIRKGLEKYAPLGRDINGEFLLYFMLLLCAICWFWLVLVAHMGQDLVSYRTGSGFSVIDGYAVSSEGVKVYYRSLIQVMKNTLFFVPVHLMTGIGIIRYNYESFRRGSMSIYTMKRVPDPLEIHKRALSLPLAFIALTVIIAVLFSLWGKGIYLRMLPEGALIDERIPYSFWRMFICLY